MSDNDDFMLEDEEDYGFEYEDDDEDDEAGDDGAEGASGTKSIGLTLENTYYSAKG